jgi:hypothetical protein
MESNYQKVKLLYNAYVSAKKRAVPYVGIVDPVVAKRYTTVSGQELAILENHLVSFRAVGRRVRPSLNNGKSGVTKTDKRQIRDVISMFEGLVRDYERAFKSWKKLVRGTSKKVKVHVFPISVLSSNSATDGQSPSNFVKAAVSYIRRMHRKFEEAHMKNSPIVPFRRISTNVRKTNVMGARRAMENLKRAKTALANVEKLKKNLDRAEYDLQRTTANKETATKKLSRATSVIKEMRRRTFKELDRLTGTIRSLQSDLLATKRDLDECHKRALGKNTYKYLYSDSNSNNA